MQFTVTIPISAVLSIGTKDGMWVIVYEAEATIVPKPKERSLAAALLVSDRHAWQLIEENVPLELRRRMRQLQRRQLKDQNMIPMKEFVSWTKFELGYKVFAGPFRLEVIERCLGHLGLKLGMTPEEIDAIVNG